MICWSFNTAGNTTVFSLFQVLIQILTFSHSPTSVSLIYLIFEMFSNPSKDQAESNSERERCLVVMRVGVIHSSGRML